MYIYYFIVEYPVFRTGQSTLHCLLLADLPNRMVYRLLVNMVLKESILALCN